MFTFFSAPPTQHEYSVRDAALHATLCAARINYDSDPQSNAAILLQLFRQKHRLIVADTLSNLLFTQPLTDRNAFDCLITLNQELFANRRRFGAAVYVILAAINYRLVGHHNERIDQLLKQQDPILSQPQRATLASERLQHTDACGQRWRSLCIYLHTAKFLDFATLGQDYHDTRYTSAQQLMQQRFSRLLPSTPPQNIAAAIILIETEIRQRYPITDDALLKNVAQEATRLAATHIAQPAPRPVPNRRFSLD